MFCCRIMRTISFSPLRIFFWNPWDHRSTGEVFPRILVIIMIIRRVNSIKTTGNLEDFGCLGGNFTIVTPHMILFWNPWDHGCTHKVFSRNFGHNQDDQEGQECLKTGDLEDIRCFYGDFKNLVLPSPQKGSSKRYTILGNSLKYNN